MRIQFQYIRKIVLKKSKYHLSPNAGVNALLHRASATVTAATLLGVADTCCKNEYRTR